MIFTLLLGLLILITEKKFTHLVENLNGSRTPLEIEKLGGLKNHSTKPNLTLGYVRFYFDLLK